MVNVPAIDIPVPILQFIGTIAMSGTVAWFVFDQRLKKQGYNIQTLEETKIPNMRDALEREIENLRDKYDQNIQDIKSEIKPLKGLLPITGFVSPDDIKQYIVDLNNLQGKIENAQQKIKDHNDQIDLLKQNIEKSNEDYNQFRSILDRIKDPNINPTNVEQVLETFLQKSEAINLQNQLIELERTIESIKNLNQQEYIIKTNKFNLNKENSPDLQNYREDRDRFAEHWVDFNHTFKKPPQVFIALKMIDAATEIYSKEVRHEDLNLGNAVKFLTSLRAQFIRIDVWIKEGSITENGFTVVAKTWYDSQVFGLDIAWIAFGK